MKDVRGVGSAILAIAIVASSVQFGSTKAHALESLDDNSDSLDYVLEHIRANEGRVANYFYAFTVELESLNPECEKEWTHDGKYAVDRVFPPRSESTILVDGARFACTRTAFDRDGGVVKREKRAFDGEIVRSDVYELALESGSQASQESGVVDHGPASMVLPFSPIEATHLDLLGIGHRTSELIEGNRNRTRVSSRINEEGNKTYLIAVNTGGNHPINYECEVDPEKDFSVVMARQASSVDPAKDWARIAVLDHESKDGLWFPHKIMRYASDIRPDGSLFHAYSAELTVNEVRFNQHYLDISRFQFEYPPGTRVLDKIVGRTIWTGQEEQIDGKAVEGLMETVRPRVASTATNLPGAVAPLPQLPEHKSTSRFSLRWLFAAVVAFVLSTAWFLYRKVRSLGK